MKSGDTIRAKKQHFKPIQMSPRYLREVLFDYALESILAIIHAGDESFCPECVFEDDGQWFTCTRIHTVMKQIKALEDHKTIRLLEGTDIRSVDPRT